MKTARLRRYLIAESARKSGYAVSGNHLFTLPDFRAIGRGAYRRSVSENREAHSARMQRAAQLLSRTY